MKKIVSPIVITRIVFSFSALALLFVFSCTKNQQNSVDGMKPIYISKSKMFDIQSGPPVALVSPGKIYLYGNLVFINEKGRGVHVVNNSQPSSPVVTHFISIPGNYDIAIRNNFLYADNLTDLVTININDLNAVEEVHRIKDVYDGTYMWSPLSYRGWFECVDTTKGMVVGWQKAKLDDPRCNK